MSSEVTAEQDGGIWRLTIKNAEKKNALTPSILDDIKQEISTIENQDDARVLILTGCGDTSFCSGLDISVLTSDWEQGWERDWEDQYEETLRRIRDCTIPTLAMINGDVYGGGVAIAAACDLRIAATDVRIAVTPAKLGLVYSYEGLQSLLRLVGPAATKELLFVGEPIETGRAENIGFLNRVVNRSALHETTIGIAESIANNAPLSVVTMKKIIGAILENQSLREPEKEWIDRLRSEVFESHDLEEGLTAFKENREPQFEGR